MKEIIIMYLRNFEYLFKVDWDRYTLSTDGEYSIYGWIKRSDGNRDFILLQIYLDGEDLKGTFVTSSAKYSKSIYKFMYGTTKGHNDCIKINIT